MKRFLVFFPLLAISIFLPSCHCPNDGAKGRKSRETTLTEHARTPLELQLFLVNRLKEDESKKIDRKAEAFDKAARNAAWIEGNQRALVILSQATMLANKLESAEQTKKLTLIAETTAIVGDQRAALETLKRVTTLAEKLDDADKTLLFSFVVIAMTQTDEKTFASQTLEKAVETAKGLKDSGRKIYALSMAAVAANRMEDKRQHDKMLTAVIQGKKKEALKISRDTRQMENILKRALVAAKSLKDSDKAWGLNWIAFVYVEAGMKQQGMKLLEQALVLTKKLEGMEQAKRLRELATTLFLVGEKHRAVKLLAKAAHSAYQSKDFDKIRKLRKNARSVARHGDQARAEKIRQLVAMMDSASADEWLKIAIATAKMEDFKFALELAGELDNFRKVDVFQNIAELMIQIGDKNKALQTLAQAVPMCASIQGDDQAFALCQIADVLTQAEGKEFSPQGRDLSQKILTIALQQ